MPLVVLLGLAHGQNLNPGDFPAQVILRIAPNRVGEGVLLNANHVLTLAENCFDAEHKDVRLAPTAITVVHSITLLVPTSPAVPVQRIYAHDHYNFDNGKFNVCVLRVSGIHMIPWP